jgi:hypothetical protein
VSLYYDSGVLVKLYVREPVSDAVTAFVARRGEAIAINGLHELEIRNALRLKRFRAEIDAGQLAASMAMLAGDIARRRLIRAAFDWRLVRDEAERLSGIASETIGTRTIDLLHVAAALSNGVTGLVSLDHRQSAAARLAGLEVIEP